MCVIAKRPLVIDIVQDTHTHTATVYNFSSLERYVRTIHDNGCKWKFGTVHQYGTFKVPQIVAEINGLKSWSSYNKSDGSKDVR